MVELDRNCNNCSKIPCNFISIYGKRNSSREAENITGLLGQIRELLGHGTNRQLGSRSERLAAAGLPKG